MTHTVYYGIDIDKSLFYITTFVLNAKLCSIYALIFEVFGGLNLVYLSGFWWFLLKKYWLIFKIPVATLHSARRKLTPRAPYA